jgi:DNA-binding response OmpR family regulator
VSSVVPGRAKHPRGPDRRRFPRGGRRTEDRPGRCPRVAIIEQYDGVRRPCARYLEHFNFDVIEAADLHTGLTVLETAPPAVVLVEASDTPAFERLHDEARLRGIPLLSLATAFPEVDEQSATRAPAGILLKPFTLGAMLDEIRRVLGAQMRGAPAATAFTVESSM